MCRQHYARDTKRVVLLQSCIRRHQAKNELKVLKNEARSVVHFKEVSYKLENKVIELTQSLQKRTLENKEMQSKLKTLEGQLQSWMTRFEDSDTKAKALHLEAQKPTVALAEHQALDAHKQDLDSRLAGSLKTIAEQDAQIQQLTAEFTTKTRDMEERHTALQGTLALAADDSTTVASLRGELASLREQLTRQVSTAQKTPSRPEGGAFNMTTGRAVENGLAPAAGATLGVAGLMASPSRRRARRHSDVGAEQMNGGSASSEEERYESPRPVSVSYPQDNVKRLPGGKTYLPDIYDDPAEEIMKLLEDEVPLDEDVLAGIIRHLKIPSPNLTSPPSPKEVLFPAHLISLVTNEMWKYGMMRESERFLANVMQTVQLHVMVRPPSSPLVLSY
jgi:myosin-5